MVPLSVRYPLQVALLAAAYLAVAMVGLEFAIPPGNATAVWPTSGVALAAVLLLGTRVWPGIWLGALMANSTTTVSFAAAAQFAPAILLGIYWKGASRLGALAGLSGGFIVWTYTLLLPSFARSGWITMSFVEPGPFGISALGPYHLFDLTVFDPITHSVFWSMLVNIGLLVGVSLFSRQEALEQLQAAMFVDVYKKRAVGAGDARLWHGKTQVSDLKGLMARMIGADRAEEAFLSYASTHPIELRDDTLADESLVAFMERELAGTVGATSARVMVSSIIEGEALSIEAIRRLQKALPDARFTIYFWDSYRNMPKDSFQKVALFDRALTFDPLDAVSDNRLTYRPLFFVEEQVNLPAVEQDIDLLFFGTAHDDRYSIVKGIERGLPHGVNFAKVLYIPSKGIYYFRRCFDPAFWRAKRDEFIFTPLSKRNIMELVARARAVVDIERVVQTGYTMRSIETIGAGRKIISTNARLAEADFYHENNVAVIDRSKPRVDPGFLESPFVMPKRQVWQRYTLSSWLDDVLHQ